MPLMQWVWEMVTHRAACPALPAVVPKNRAAHTAHILQSTGGPGAATWEHCLVSAHRLFLPHCSHTTTPHHHLPKPLPATRLPGHLAGEVGSGCPSLPGD